MENITMTTTPNTAMVTGVCTPVVGMPGHGSALRTSGVVWADRGRVVEAARGRYAGQPTAVIAAAGTAVSAAAKDAFPGTDAWSPPRR